MLEFADGSSWEAWLAKHHASETEAWLRIGRKHARVGLLSIDDAAEGGLCFGWIDGQRKSFDEVSFLQRYCPRTSRSTWSRVNVAKAEALIAAGRMRPAGLAEIEAAKLDGRWEAAYASQREAKIPDELAAALAADPAARAVFEGLGRSEQYGVYLPILKASTPSARVKALARALGSLQRE